MRKPSRYPDLARRRRIIRSQAQYKHGCNIYRKIWHRENWQEPWEKAAVPLTRVQRWALRKFSSPPSIYRQLKHIDRTAPESARVQVELG